MLLLSARFVRVSSDLMRVDTINVFQLVNTALALNKNWKSLSEKLLSFY